MTKITFSLEHLINDTFPVSEIFIFMVEGQGVKMRRPITTPARTVEFKLSDPIDKLYPWSETELDKILKKEIKKYLND